MQKKLKVLGVIFSLVILCSCNTETHSNPVEPEDEVIVENTEVIVEDVIGDEELIHKITGSWSLNADTGQKDFNEDGTYKGCELFVAEIDNSETEFCDNGNWSIENGELRIILESGDTINNTMMWVFDNVVYLGTKDDGVNKEDAWELGMTKL